MKAARRKKVRVLLCKPSLDMHSRGVMVIARALRDAGMEVVYLEASPQVGAKEIIQTQMQEAADVIGMSILSGSPAVIVSKLLAERDRNGLTDVPVVVGGIVPEEEVEALKRRGVAAVFHPGASMTEIVTTIRRLAEGGEGAA
jgi:methylmalonyl-CoA mutase C-terminal domain/subunit